MKPPITKMVSVRVATVRPAIPITLAETVWRNVDRRQFEVTGRKVRARFVEKVTVIEANLYRSGNEGYVRYAFGSVYAWNDTEWVSTESWLSLRSSDALWCSIGIHTLIVTPDSWFDGRLDVMVDLATVEPASPLLNELAAEIAPKPLIQIPIAMATSRARRFRKAESRRLRDRSPEVIDGDGEP